MVRKETKAAVMAELAQQGRDAQQNGQEVYSTLCRNNPSIPISVITEVWMDLCDEEEEAWWDSVEKTIDGEVIRRAITGK